MTERRIRIGEEELVYSLQKKKMKNIYLRVRADGTVYVTAPNRTKDEFLDAFVRSRVDFIHAAREKVRRERENNILLHELGDGTRFSLFGEEITLRIQQAQTEQTTLCQNTLYLAVRDPSDSNRIAERWEQFMTEQCRAYFPVSVEKMSATLSAYSVPEVLLRIRVMKSRWGSCMPKKGIVTLNRRLIEADRACIDYVVLHELCHFVFPDHSERFHALMSARMPDWKARKRRLNQSVSLTQ